ncbi:MAG TPA: hypothetical protein VFG64_04975 [Dongiaceae bacterium]|nr:hypothetical protein [Dongiaceae bacterium]
MIRRFILFGIVALASAAAGCSSPLKQLPPGLPSASPDATRDAANGGRVQSIAVDPQDRNHAVIAMQFGGLWRTFNAGETWFRTYTLPAIYVTDVEFAAAGKTVVASVFRDNQVVTGGGIYVSHDGGDDWSRPATGIVPTCRRVGPADDVSDADLEPVALAAFPCDAVRTPARTSAYSVSGAPDVRGLWYVGTDFGVAVSADDGATWKHHRIDPSIPLATDRQQDAAQSVLAMPGGTVLALLRTGLYRSDDRGEHWRRVIEDDFNMFAPMGGNFGAGGNKMDRSPFAPWAFIFKKYQTDPAHGSGEVWFYELDTETKTLLPLRQGRSRGPFVRVSKDNASGGQSISVWVGAGWDGYFVTREDAASIRAISSTADHEDWVSYIAPAGIHADMGDMGLDGDLQRAYVGTDGGIFKPVEDADSLRLISAAPAGSGMNSLQITDLAGTNVTDGNGRVSTTLYFATQDNQIWSSADGGNTWPTNQSDGAEGNSLEVRSDTLLGEPVTVGYSRFGKSGNAKRFADALLQNSREVPELDQNGQSLAPALFGPFYLEGAGGTARWFRVRVPSDSLPPSEVFISQNDGSNWRKRFEIPFKWKGSMARTNIGAGLVVATGAIMASAPDTAAIDTGAIDRGLMAWIPVETGPTVDTGEGTFNAIGLVRLSDLYANRVDTIDPSKVVRLSGNGSLGDRFTEFDRHAIFGADPFDWRFLIAPDIVNNVVKVSHDGGNTWAIDGALTAEVLKGGKLKMWGGKPDLMSVTEIAFDPYQKRRILVGTRDSGIICSPNNGVTWRTIKDSPHIGYITGFHFRPDGGVYISSYGHGLWFLRAVKGCPEAEDLPWDRKPPIGTGTEATDAFARGPREPSTPAPEPASFAELLVASAAGTGTAVLGEDNRLAVSGRGFAPGEAVVLTVLDGALLKKAVRADKNGRFALVIAMPEDFPHGQFTIEAVRKGKPGISPFADFSKGYTDDDEEEREMREQDGEPENEELTE